MNLCPPLSLSQKKEKLGDKKGDTMVLPSVQIASSSITPSLEVTAFTPPTIRSKGKGKVGKSVWDNLGTTLGRAYNVVTDDELKSLTSIPSHELVSHHIHKLVQVYSFLSCIYLLLFFFFKDFLLTSYRSLGSLCA